MSRSSFQNQSRPSAAQAHQKGIAHTIRMREERNRRIAQYNYQQSIPVKNIKEEGGGVGVSVGAFAGGAIGTFLGGPVGGIIGAIVGGFLGDS